MHKITIGKMEIDDATSKAGNQYLEVSGVSGWAAEIEKVTCSHGSIMFPDWRVEEYRVTLAEWIEVATGETDQIFTVQAFGTARAAGAAAKRWAVAQVNRAVAHLRENPEILKGYDRIALVKEATPNTQAITVELVSGVDFISTPPASSVLTVLGIAKIAKALDNTASKA
jgi:hypothetical protein